MKLQMSSNYSVKSKTLCHLLLKNCNIVTNIALNSIIAISLTSYAAFAANPPSKVKTSTFPNEQSIETCESTTLPSSILQGEIKLDCPTRLNLLKHNDSPTGSSEESLLKIPKKPIIPNPNQNETLIEKDQSKMILFEIRF